VLPSLDLSGVTMVRADASLLTSTPFSPALQLNTPRLVTPSTPTLQLNTPTYYALRRGQHSRIQPGSSQDGGADLGGSFLNKYVYILVLFTCNKWC
jgi:hypothetical protein